MQHQLVEEEHGRQDEHEGEGQAVGHGPSHSGRRDPWVGARDALLLGARLLVAQLFLLGAAQKVTSPGQVEALLAGRGWPEWLVWPALAFNLGAGMALALGWRVRPLALALAAYCMVTSLFHWIPADPWQMTIFVKNWAVAGGCLALAAAGSGRYALGRGRS